MDTRILAIIGIVLGLGLAAPGAAADGIFPQDGPQGLGGAAAADSVRSNLWLVEALMGEIVAEAAAHLPPAPARVLLPGTPAPTDLQGQLMRLVAVRVLSGRGFELFTGNADSLRGRTDVSVEFLSSQVALAYPEVGRTLGLWRRWVERDVTVASTVRLVESDSGRLLLERRLERRFSDRVPDEEFMLVDDKTYPFTNASLSGSGWQRRLEEFAVLGTLAGLVAVYFANTGD
ncbi:MAG: hypothetical protein IPK64_08775 [bacterium]|nr:hypothetical protein [bacterium]